MVDLVTPTGQTTSHRGTMERHPHCPGLCGVVWAIGVWQWSHGSGVETSGRGGSGGVGRGVADCHSCHHWAVCLAWKIHQTPHLWLVSWINDRL